MRIAPRPLTDFQKALILRLRMGDIASSDLKSVEKRTMRSLHARHLAVPTFDESWSITADGKAFDLDAPSEPKREKTPKGRSRQKYFDGNPLKCPTCESTLLRVIDTRDHRGTTRRRRQCRNKHRFWTVEVLSNYAGDIADNVHPEKY